jgi:hypothetical protein
MNQLQLVLGAALVVLLLPPASADEIGTTSTYFNIRSDFRRCAQPLCGGYWVKRVNLSDTRCNAAGVRSTECYVAEIDWKAAGLSAAQAAAFQSEIAAGRGLIRGTIASKTYPDAGRLSVLAATEAWRAISASPPGGVFYRVSDNGVRCNTTPCFWIHSAKLNSSLDRDVSSLDLSAVRVTAEGGRKMLSAAGSSGILAAGTYRATAAELIASQAYLQLRP